jgi:hypothetical protein
MPSITRGLHQLKSKITIHAPVEVCYQSWLDSLHLPDAIRRVLGCQYQPINVAPITSAEEIQAKTLLLQDDILSSRIKHWLFSGPGGKLYEIENAAILEIPNHLYCTTSTDPSDLSTQSSVLFSPDDLNINTLVEWKVSFWISSTNGRSTQLATDILASDDAFLEDCLQDFKRYIESK